MLANVTCPKCGQKNEIDRELCWSCFTSLNNKTPVVAPNKSQVSSKASSSPLSHSLKFRVRKHLLSIFGGHKLSIYDALGKKILTAKPVLFSARLALSLRNESGVDVLTIRQRDVAGLNLAYDVADAITHEELGALRRNDLYSEAVADNWEILDSRENLVGIIKEDSVGLAMLRRYFPIARFAQKHEALVGVNRVGEFRHNYLFMVTGLSVVADFSSDPRQILDRRMGTGGGCHTLCRRRYPGKFGWAQPSILSACLTKSLKPTNPAQGGR